jgi:hypothetical protein
MDAKLSSNRMTSAACATSDTTPVSDVNFDKQGHTSHGTHVPY